MSTEEGVVLEPHQVAVDHQELRRLHCLMGTMLGGSAPAAAGAPSEAIPYALPTVGRDEKKYPMPPNLLNSTQDEEAHGCAQGHRVPM